MPSKKQTLRHVFNGGWATDFGDIAEVGISESGLVQVPFLTKAENVTFELDGATHKIGGTTQMNGTQITGGDEVVGLYDYWNHATGASVVQELVCHAGTKVWTADLDGNFTDRSSGTVGALTDGAVPSYNTFDDLLIVCSSGTAANDEPASWDGSTYQKLAGSPPHLSFTATHKNRVWGAGVSTLPSRLFYSAHVDPEDWSGAGSGFIDIDPNDGDRITALASYKDNLWIFKGPYKGSIHRIVGSAPTGSDSFGRQTFVRGLGAVGHNTLFMFKDDLGFMWSDGSIHSLKAVASFGDFNEAALSRPINKWIRDNITGGQLAKAWAATDSVNGGVLFSLPANTNTQNSVHLWMDYRFEPVRWAKWDAFTSGALATVSDNGIPRLFDGGNDTASSGYVRRLLGTSKSIDGSGSISATTVTPFISYGTSHNMKQLERASVGISPKGDYSSVFGWTRDDTAEKTQTFDQKAVGTALGSFILGTSQLGGSTFRDTFMSLEEGGEFRQIQYRVSDTAVDQDLQVHHITATIGPGANSGEN